MKKTLRKRFIVFAMCAVTVLLVVLVGAINVLNWMILEKQSDRVLETLVQADGTFGKMNFDRPPPLNMDIMRATRFFTVRSHAAGEILEVNIDQISSVDKATAIQYATAVLARGRMKGWVGSFKYAVKQQASSRLIFFMDTSNQKMNFLTVLIVSSIIAACCWVIVFLFVLFLSGKVIRPILAGMEKQKQFITNAGHELKTPLAIIQSNNDAMTLIHGENKYNQHIRTQTRRLNVLMSNLLTLARLDEEIPLPAESVNISKITSELIAAYADIAHSRQILFSTQIEPDLIIQTNPDSFRQILTVLLDNAVKYTPDSGTICLSLNKHGGRTLLITENTCNPRHESDPERLFERFYRGNSARTQDTEPSGYGIGLSAARAVCENLGGKLTAQYLSPTKIRFTARI